MLLLIAYAINEKYARSREC